MALEVHQVYSISSNRWLNDRESGSKGVTGVLLAEHELVFVEKLPISLQDWSEPQTTLSKNSSVDLISYPHIVYRWKEAFADANKQPITGK